MQMEGVDAYKLIQYLKTVVSKGKHGDIDKLYVSYSADPRPVNQRRVVQDLQKLVGPEKLQEALDSAMTTLGQGGPSRAGVVLNSGHDREEASEYEADESESEAISKMQKGNIEICEATLKAWNHCVECKKAPTCEVSLCKELQPFVEHLRKMRSEGVVGVCLESCRFCNFFDNLKRRVVPFEEKMSSRKRKEAAKAKKLVQLFTAFLLKHGKNMGDDSIAALYDHVMSCLDDPCHFRNEMGSCRSSRALMFHLQDCRFEKTRTCELCSKLPPHVWRMKKKRRSLPKPAYVAKRIEDERKDRQREKRRQRTSNKRNAASSSTNGGDPHGASHEFDEKEEDDDEDDDEEDDNDIDDEDEMIGTGNTRMHADGYSLPTSKNSHTGSNVHPNEAHSARFVKPSALNGTTLTSRVSSDRHITFAEDIAQPRNDAHYYPLGDQARPPADGMSPMMVIPSARQEFYDDHFVTNHPGKFSAPIAPPMNDNLSPQRHHFQQQPVQPQHPYRQNMHDVNFYGHVDGGLISNEINMLSLADGDPNLLGKRKPDDLYLPGHFDKRGRV